MGPAQTIDQRAVQLKVFKLVEEGRRLEKFQIFPFAVIVHSERHYHVNGLDLFPVVGTMIELNRSNTKLEKAMASHSTTLAWKIPWVEEPDRLQSLGSLRVGQD